MNTEHFQNNEELDEYARKIIRDAERLRREFWRIFIAICLFLMIVLSGVGFSWLVGLLK